MFTVNGKELNKTLSQIRRVVGNVELCYLTTKDKGLEVRAQNDQTVVAKKVNATVKKELKFGANIEVLSNAVANREDIEFSESGDNEIKFHSNKYKGNLLTVPYNNVTVIPKNIEKSSSNNVSGTLKEALFELLSKVSLVHVFDKSKVLTAMLRCEGKYMYLATADHYHAAIAIYENKSKLDLNFDFPVSYIDIINQIAGDASKVKLNVDDNCIYVWSPEVKLCLPQLSVPEIDFNNLKKLMDNYTKPNTIVETPIKEFRKVLDNVSSVYEDGASVHMMAKKKSGLRLLCKTNYGTVQDHVNAPVRKTNNKNIELESKNLYDSISNISGDVTVQLFDDICLMQQDFENGKLLYYVLAMS